MILSRLRLLLIFFTIISLVIVARLFYWQVISAESLAALAEKQRLAVIEILAQRGKILTSDDFSLVGSEPAYLAYAYLPELDRSPQDIAQLLAPIVRPDPEDATTAAQPDIGVDISLLNQTKLIKKLTQDTAASLSSRLASSNLVWVPLARKLSPDKKHQIETLNLKGIGFEPEQVRFYPEASMAAHLLGFVGSDVSGNPKGYFGLEGYYDLELKGRPGIIRQEKDATGKPILVGTFGGFSSKDGRSLKLHLDRAVQRIAEIELEHALERYGASSGDVVVMDPKTGGIIASASLPKYEPKKFSQSGSHLYKNPVIADTYEPGSTFKVLVMSAALDADAVEPDTKCDICTGPVDIGQYTISTWNDKYYPDSTMTEVIQHSDNIGMVFVGQKLGKEKLYDYLKNFGLGEPTGIDLEEETVPDLRPANKWGDIHLATASFGQGIAVTAIEMLTAVNAIANQGVLLQPQVVNQIIGDKVINLPPRIVRRVVSPETAATMTQMMVNSVESGEAQWTKIPGYKIAGKTGTSQIPIAGHYDADKTIASYVGFAPADDPKFTMLVKLREPTSSPWAADTAAPLWMRIARQLFLYYGLPPQN